jgi:hypothetical protein
MTSPHHGSRPPACVLRPARHHHAGLSNRMQRAGRSSCLTFWLDSPYQGFRWGYRCPSGALTTPGSWSVHGRRATDGRRGTDLLAGHRRAHTVKAGVLTLSGKRAGGGLRTGQAPGTGEATPAHAPARPPWSVAGAVALRAPARPAPHRTRALSQHRHKADSPACGRVRPATAAWSAPSLTIFRLPLCSVRGPGRALACVRTGTVHARKGTSGMTSTVSQRSTRQPPRTVTRQVTRPPRPADAPADPGRAVGAGQRLNIPAGGDRD